MVAAKEAHVAQWKRDVVDEISRLLLEYPVIGIADISGVPARQLQQLRQKLRGEHRIVVTKNTLLRLAMEGIAEKPKLREISGALTGQCALLLSKSSPFKIQKILKENVASAPAKPGSKAEKDIIIPAGETDIPPGPAVGELQRVGIKARIQAGKVVILEDCKLVKKGDVITKEISDILAKFGILPIQQGLKLKVAVEGNLVFSPEVLAIDEETVKPLVVEAGRNAFNLAINILYFTKETIGIFLARGAASARALVTNAGIPVKELMPEILANAQARMLSLAAAIGGKSSAALDQELLGMIGQAAAAQPKEEPPKEEPSEKPKEEKKEEDLSGLGALFG
ncbi:MAG: 50S ribosomal protein L10 [Candidatus Hadarchaeales archaeon]